MRRWGPLAAGLVLGGVIAYACTTDTAIGPDDTLRLTAVGVDSTGQHFAYSRAVWSTGNSEIELTPTGSVIALATAP